MSGKRKSNKQNKSVSNKKTKVKKQTQPNKEVKEDDITIWQAESVLKNAMDEIGFDGALFVGNVKDSVELRKRQGKEPKQIRYLHYVTWAVALRRKEIGPV